MKVVFTPQKYNPNIKWTLFSDVTEYILVIKGV